MVVDPSEFMALGEESDDEGVLGGEQGLDDRDRNGPVARDVAGLAAEQVEPAADRVDHPPQLGPVLRVAVQVGVHGAVPVGPAPPGPFGLPGLPALLRVGAGRLDQGDLLVELGQRAALGLIDQLAGLVGVGGHPVGDRRGLLERQLPGGSRRGHVRLVGHPPTGFQRPLGRGRAHPGFVGQLFRGTAVTVELPVLALRGSGRGQRLDRRRRRLDPGAQPDHLTGLPRGQSPSVEIASKDGDRLSQRAQLTAHGSHPGEGALPGRRTADDPARPTTSNVCSMVDVRGL